MLVIRLKRTGRSGHATFRLVVQDSRTAPSSGKVVAYLGSFDPHSKEIKINKEETAKYLANGAQPSPRATKLLKEQGIKLPKWVAKEDKKKGQVRHPEKRRSTAPEGTVVEKPAETEEAAAEPPEDAVPSDDKTSEEPAAEESPQPEEQPTETTAEPAVEESPKPEEQPAEAAEEDKAAEEPEKEAEA